MTKRQTPAAESARAFSIDGSALRGALKDVADVVERRNTIPILANILLTVTPSSLTLTATDLDAWGERHVALDGHADPMAMTVDASTLTRIADKLPVGAQVRLSHEGGKLTVVAGRSRFSLPTLPIDDFPMMPAKQWEAEFEMPAIMLAGALSTCGFAMSTEETRYYLNGVFVHAPEGADLRFAATDGHRLSRGLMAVPDGAQTLPDVIVPRKVVKVLTTLLGRHEGSVDVRVNAGSIRVEIGNTVIQAKTIDGTFPDYARIIPTANELLLKVDREALIAAVQRVTTVATDKTRAVKMVIDRHDRIVLSVSSPENGTAAEEVPCDWTGTPLTVGFNSRYLLDVLGHLTAIEIEGTFADAAAPTLWRDREAASAIFVLMPLRV